MLEKLSKDILLDLLNIELCRWKYIKEVFSISEDNHTQYNKGSSSEVNDLFENNNSEQ